jgi:hypothetical protein
LHPLAGPVQVEPTPADQGLGRRARALLFLAAVIAVVTLALGVTAAVDATVGIRVNAPSSR